MLLIACNETTRILVGNGMLAFLSFPELMQRLQEDAGLTNPGVSEMLRFVPPVRMDKRTARADMVIGGKRIRAVQNVVSVIGAAN